MDQQIQGCLIGEDRQTKLLLASSNKALRQNRNPLKLELPVENASQMLLKHGIIQTLEDGSEEATHDELRRLLGWNASGHHVEEFILVEFA